MTQLQPDISFVSSSWDSIPDAYCFSHNSMATVFEVIIIHKDTQYAQQAAQAAFDELDRLEQQLSRFIENSDISRLNNLPANQPLQLGLEAFECIQLSASLYEQTSGAFDVTVGSLMDCWLSEEKTLLTPSKEQLDEASRCTGLPLVKLDEIEHTIELLTSPVKIDLGGIGKGYAIDQMAKLLDDWSIDTALINGGCSSVLAIGKPVKTKGWHITLSNPVNNKQTLTNFYLQNQAVSGSGLLKGLHIIDPHTSQPANDKKAAWACAPAATTTDALSTSFMIMSPELIRKYCLDHPDTLAMVVTEERNSKAQKVLRYGLWE